MYLCAPLSVHKYYSEVILETQVQLNRPFPSSCMPPLQGESKCEVFVVKISFHLYVK